MTDQSASAASVASIAGGYRKTIAKRLLIVGTAVAILCLTVLLDVVSGPFEASIGRVVHVIFVPSTSTVNETVVIWDLRLPVALKAVAVGAMLGVAGAEMQTILNNPLADPFTLGLSSAASFGAALAIVLGWSLIAGVGGLFVTVNAFMLAMITSLGLYAYTRLRGVSPEAMILVGIAMLFTFNALLMFQQCGAYGLRCGDDGAKTTARLEGQQRRH